MSPQVALSVSLLRDSGWQGMGRLAGYGDLLQNMLGINFSRAKAIWKKVKRVTARTSYFRFAFQEWELICQRNSFHQKGKMLPARQGWPALGTMFIGNKKAGKEILD